MSLIPITVCPHAVDLTVRNCQICENAKDHELKLLRETVSKAADDLRKSTVEIGLAQSKLDAITKFVDAQAEDNGLWCEPCYVSEAYIQKGLRGLHAYIESVVKDGPRAVLTKNTKPCGCLQHWCPICNPQSEKDSG